VFCGRLPDTDLPDAYACGDVFAMLCRNRWFGLEQEGFGIVFVEAAAAGVAAVAGESGGAAEAVAAGETGLVVDPPSSVEAAADALAHLLDDPERRAAMAAAGRARAEKEFAYDVLAARLADALEAG
jgi:phosphatidylinositol alpha-1,6-mannosyltransferase